MCTRASKVASATWFAPVALAILTGQDVTANAIDIGGDDSQAWEVCALCHGADGISVMAKFPKLAGQNYHYLVKQIKDFREQRRTNDGGQMAAISTEIKENEIAGIALYFSDLPLPKREKIQNETEIERHHLGGKLYQKHCSSCHDDNKVAPQLKGQHQSYLIKQLDDFRGGRRANNGDQEMQDITQKLDADTLDTIIFYLTTQLDADE